MTLSTGESLNGPDKTESDSDYDAEVTSNNPYNGKVVWIIEDSDPFEIDWLELSFSVHDLSYDESQVEFDVFFDILIEDINPEAADEGVQDFAVAKTVTEQGFTVTINELILGKQQEGQTGKILNYVALDLEMKAE